MLLRTSNAITGPARSEWFLRLNWILYAAETEPRRGWSEPPVRTCIPGRTRSKPSAAARFLLEFNQAACAFLFHSIYPGSTGRAGGRGTLAGVLRVSRQDPGRIAADPDGTGPSDRDQRRG